MALSIIVPYVPLQMIFFSVNIIETLPELAPYDYNNIHNGTDPYSWNAIFFWPSWMQDFATLNQPWVAILTTIPIVLFFGMTEEAHDIYRKFLVRIGFGKCFLNLKDLRNSDQSRCTDSSQKGLWSSSKNKKPGFNEA